MSEALVIAALILLNGFFALSELALVSAKPARLQALADAGRSGARLALQLRADPTRFLSATQIGISLVSILTGVYSGAAIAESVAGWLGSLGVQPPLARQAAFGGVVVSVTIASIILGELIPKRIALAHAEPLAVWTAPPMRLFALLASPLVWVLKIVTDAVLRFVPVSAAPSSTLLEDEIRALVAEGARTGEFAPTERRLIEGVFALADRKAASIMVPRPEVPWLDLDEPLPALWQQAKDSGQSRFLAAHGSLEDLVGTITLAALSEALRRGSLVPELDVEPALHVPDGVSVLQLLERFRTTGQHLAVITDEYGDVEGIATPMDILRAIGGELRETGGVERAEARRRGDGSWLVDGHLPMEELQAVLARRDLASPNDYATAAGFVLWKMGRIPAAGDVLEHDGLRIEVLDMDGPRIDKLLVALAPERADPSG